MKSQLVILETRVYIYSPRLSLSSGKTECCPSLFRALAAVRAVQHGAQLKSTGAGSGWGGVRLSVFVFCVLETGFWCAAQATQTHGNPPASAPTTAVILGV